jgi:hypothetical protein
MNPVSTSIRYVNPDGTVNQAGYNLLLDLQNVAMNIEAAAAVPPPAGGGTVDVEARAAIASIIASAAGDARRAD